MSAAELSRKTGIARQVISDWQAGVHPRNLIQLKTIADAFGVSLESLCFGDCEPVAATIPAAVARDTLGGVYQVIIIKTEDPKTD
jgi:transcriptional regulator with XRE-family HTH domain